ncbi:MAG: S8 family serine peptidase [Woeseiaceae bacterium]
MRSIRLATLLLLLAGGAAAQVESDLQHAGSLGGIRLADSEEPATRKVYIVQLKEPSAAAYHAQSRSLASKAGVQSSQFNKAQPEIQAYTAQLAQTQDRVFAKAGPDAEMVYRYQYGLNGFAANMHPSQAHKLEAQPEVLKVWEDEIRPLVTNHSLNFLELFDADNGLRGASNLDGKDVVIGVIDSGIAPEHPALQDTREADRPSMCLSDWAENTFLGLWLCRRYDKRDDLVVFEPLEGWEGTCQAGEQFETTDCNNKIIGAQYFSAGAEATGPIDAGEIMSARDVDGHGTHTATTAAGNRVKASIFGSFISRIDGVAPGARISVYKACWLRPGDMRASCNTSDLANAIDAAVADGVDIINYSVGSSQVEVSAPDDIALMAATKAGVFTVVAAGNDGPNRSTIGSPAGGPWVITAGASTRDGNSTSEAMEVLTPTTIAGLYVAKEANFTPTLESVGPIEDSLVLVDDGTDTESDACEALVNGNDVADKIAFIQRGGCDFEVKLANAEDAGAIAAIVYNIAGDPIVMNGDEGVVDIPAVMIGQADGNLILAELDRLPDVTVKLDKNLFLEERDTGNTMGSFSSRGLGPVVNIIKPDVTAPGVNILAGFTPDAINATKGENFAYLSGTSMSTPHIAGVAALLLQANPDWSPSAMKSALMTTTRQNVTLADGETQATPFDFGSGHIVPNSAADPGLVYDVSDEEFDAFACGIASPAVSPERCTELAQAGYSFEGEDLNQPSIAIAHLAGEQTVRRNVTNVSDEATTYTAEIVPPSGVQVTVSPTTLTVQPGATASFDVTFSFMSGPLDLWRFGSLTWTSNDRDIYSPLAIRPAAVTAPAEITRLGESGTIQFSVEFGYTGPYAPGVHGLRLPAVIGDGVNDDADNNFAYVENDPTKTFTFRFDNGVTPHLVDVPADQIFLRFALFDALTDGDDDLDMYIYYCEDNINCVKIGDSGEPTSQEEFNLFYPPAGRYLVLVHGFETDEVAGGPGAIYRLLGWSFGLNDDAGNMTVSGPSFANSGTTETVTVNWGGLLSDTIYLGGISHNTPQGISSITLIRIGN